MREDRGSFAEEELNRFWNAVVAGANRSALAPEALDSATAETIRQLYRLGATPAPASSRERVQRGIREQLLLGNPTDAEGRDPALTATMRQRNAHHPPRAIDPTVHGPFDADLARFPLSPSNGRVRDTANSGNGWASISLTRSRTASRQLLMARAGVTRVAAAILLVVVVASAAVALLYPLRLWEAGQRVFVAGSETATGEAGLTGERTLLDLTLTDFPTYSAQLGMAIATLPPGSNTEQRSGAGPLLFYVAEGPVTVRAKAAPEPLWVIPPGSTGAHPLKDLIAQGEQATIETGITLLAPEGAVVDLFTTGTASAQVVLLLSATDDQWLDEGVTWRFASNGGSIHVLDAPVSISLRQGILEPAAEIPAPAFDATRQVVAPLGEARMGDLRSGTGGAVRNAGERPVDLYVLTVTTGNAASPLSSR